jgi:integrase
MRLASAAVSPAPSAPDALERVRARVDLRALIARGWDPEARVFAPAADDALFGYHSCERAGCLRAGQMDRARALGLCDACTRNYLARVNGGRGVPMTLDQFKAFPARRVAQADREERLCLVCCTPGHERASRNHGLCPECNRHRFDRRQTIEAFIAGDERWPAAVPRRTHGRCVVNGCRRWAVTDERLCKPCRDRWRRAPEQRHPPTMLEFIATGPWQLPFDGKRAVMPEVPELVEWQLLGGLQLLIEQYAVQTPLDMLASAWAHVARAEVGSVLDLGQLPGTYQARRAIEAAIVAARRWSTSPEQERVRDVWDLGVFGIADKREIDFTHLRQRWLREAAKGYTLERLATRKTHTAHRDLDWLRHLSDYLRVREDRGEDPSVLTREDMTGFLSWLRVRVPDPKRRHHVVSATRRHVQFARRHLAGTGQPAERIGAGFQLYHEDHPEVAHRDPDEPGKALPPVVLAQLLDQDILSGLGAGYLEYRVGFELAAHTGRRPSEICNLAADCLRYEEEPAPGGGKHRRPVMRYVREKPPAKALSLPINEDTAAMIEAQQRRLVRRFPHTELSKLPLLPRRRCNPTGRLALFSPTLSYRVSKWVRSLPTLFDEDGSVFSRERVYLYALRHSYAQRHADAGVPIDTLQKLMDHRTTATTQIYYRVTWSRKREAIERVAPLTIDRNGRRVGFHSELVETERLREEIGRIPVPLGYCTEQHNVRALGAHCPFSHQCLGCEHFRTDPSHLPDLYAYLERLLETRERLRAAVPQLAEWARSKAIPADAEIRTVRTLIRAGEDALDGLQPGERAKLLELFRVLRATRARMDGSVAVEQVASIRNPEPSFLPPAFTPLPPLPAPPATGAAA